MPHATIRRYSLIIDKISRKTFPSFSELKDCLFEQGFEISGRTLQRDIEQIRYEFGLEIAYDRSRNGYFIDEELSFDIDGFLRFLEIVNTAELLAENLKDSKEALQHISFESSGGLRGIQNLKPLLKAVKEHRVVTFIHENFETGKRRDYTLMPYMLKEYLNRWYLIGLIEHSDIFWTFGIDRVFNLQLSDQTFTPDTSSNPSDNFRHTIGLTYSTASKQDVILSFTRLQGKYVKALPMHWSQEILQENERELIIRLCIIPNLEFIQRVLMLGPNVKVLEPEWVAKEVKEALQEALTQYD